MSAQFTWIIYETKYDYINSNHVINSSLMTKSLICYNNDTGNKVYLRKWVWMFWIV